jgi:hypothetical protein
MYEYIGVGKEKDGIMCFSGPDGFYLISKSRGARPKRWRQILAAWSSMRFPRGFHVNQVALMTHEPKFIGSIPFVD